MRSSIIRVLGGSVAALALLVLMAGASGRGAGVARAQAAVAGATSMSSVTVDGTVPPPDSCLAGDSWCAYCTYNAASDICSAFPPAQLSSSGTVSQKTNPQGGPAVAGVDAGNGGSAPLTYPTSMSTMGGLVTSQNVGVVNAMIGASWQWCTTINGGSWILLGSSPLGYAC